jgi:hypothetical protein
MLTSNNHNFLNIERFNHHAADVEKNSTDVDSAVDPLPVVGLSQHHSHGKELPQSHAALLRQVFSDPTPLSPRYTDGPEGLQACVSVKLATDALTLEWRVGGQGAVIALVFAAEWYVWQPCTRATAAAQQDGQACLQQRPSRFTVLGCAVPLYCNTMMHDFCCNCSYTTIRLLLWQW